MWSFTILRAMTASSLVEFPCMSSRCLLIENAVSGRLLPWLLLSTHLPKLNNWGYSNWPEPFLIEPIFLQYTSYALLFWYIWRDFEIKNFESILPVTKPTCFALLFILILNFLIDGDVFTLEKFPLSPYLIVHVAQNRRYKIGHFRHTDQVLKQNLIEHLKN